MSRMALVRNGQCHFNHMTRQHSMQACLPAVPSMQRLAASLAAPPAGGRHPPEHAAAIARNFDHPQPGLYRRPSRRTARRHSNAGKKLARLHHSGLHEVRCTSTAAPMAWPEIKSRHNALYCSHQCNAPCQFKQRHVREERAARLLLLLLRLLLGQQ